MKLVALSVGGPREVEWRGEMVRTSIFKQQVEGPRHVSLTNIDGDTQSDLTVHGGVWKAVYAYPSEHYPFWRDELGAPALSWGDFGENLTTDGLLEPDACVGDRCRIGTAEFAVSQPRLPCFKLGIRLGRPDIVKRFEHSGRSGFYLSVIREGQLQAGDRVERISRDERRLSIAALLRLLNDHDRDAGMLEVAASHPSLSASWRDRFRSLAEKSGHG